MGRYFAKRFSRSRWVIAAALVLAGLLAPRHAVIAQSSTMPAQSAPAQTASAPAAPATAQGTDAASRKPEQEEPDETEQYKQSAMVKMFGGWFGMSTERASVVFWLLNFAVLALAAGWALMRFLPKHFRERTANIQKQIVDARTATEQANQRLAEVEKKLSKLDGEIAALHAEAAAEMSGEEKRIQAALEAEKHRILAATEQEIAAAAAMAQRELKHYAAGLAIDHAVREFELSSKVGRRMVEEFAAGLGAGKDASASVKSSGASKATLIKKAPAKKAAARKAAGKPSAGGRN